MTDAELVERALEGSEDAFTELVARYERPVFTLVLRMVRDRPVAEELAQEAFLKAFDRLASYDRSRKLSSWLFKIAHNAAIDHLRRQRLATVSLDEPVGDEADAPARTVEDRDAETPADVAERAALSRALTRAVGGLRPEYREVVLLRFQAGLEYGEIAEATGHPLGTVKTYIHRARKELAALLEAEGWGLETRGGRRS
ncbi:MAG: RNA polymerase sigma factor [Thermoanaerobaculia bacterium]